MNNINSIPSSSTQAFFAKDSQDSLQTKHFALKRIISNTVATEDSNGESLSKRRKIETSLPLASIESTISNIGNDLLLQQNPTEHLPSFIQQKTPNNSTESDSPQKAKKSKLTDKERLDNIENKKYYENLLKNSCTIPIPKKDIKLLLYKYKNKIANDDNLVIQENFNIFKTQSISELNQEKERYQKMIDDLIAKNHAFEEIHNKKIASLNELNEEKIASINYLNEQKIHHLADQIVKLTKSNNVFKIDEQSVKINKLESQIKSKNEKIKTYTRKLFAFEEKLMTERRSNDRDLLKKDKEIKSLESNEFKAQEKYKQLIETKEKALNTLKTEFTILERCVVSIEEENNAFRLKEGNLTKQCQSLQEELDEEKNATICLKKKFGEMIENSKKLERSFEEVKTIFIEFTSKVGNAILNQ